MKTSVIGFPRVGKLRELKFVTEKFFRREADAAELEKTGKKRGSVAMIADTCGVSHGPVSRFFKECIGKGYLTEKYEFTTEGAHA